MVSERKRGGRTETAYARLTKFEKALLRRLQAREAMNEAEAIRLTIREAAKARGLWPESGEELGQ
jgi:hypothetical protein